MLDIRLPIGALFILIGLLLGLYGATSSPAMYQISLGYNINLIWGGCMAAFGVAVLVWMRLMPHNVSPAERTDKEMAKGPTPESESRAV